MGREVTLMLRKLIQFILNETRQVRAHNSGFVSRRPGPIVPNHRVFAQGSAKRDDLDSMLASPIGMLGGYIYLLGQFF